MRLAYIVSAYKNPGQVVRLVERLDAQDTSFFVHVDRNADEGVYLSIVHGIGHLPNVRVLPRHPCEWGGFGHVAASLEGIRAVIDWAPDADYAILLTGQDYPIKPNGQIRRFFEEHRGSSFLDHFPLPHPEWENSGLDRIRAWHWRTGGRHFTIPPGLLPFERRTPRNLRPYGGSSYWCLTRECIEYVDRYVRAHPSVVRFYRHVDVPDELFFQTIVLNSPLAERVVNDDLRHIEWPPGAASPSILRMADLDALASSTKLYARKFDATVDADVLDAIDRTLLREDVVSSELG